MYLHLGGNVVVPGKSVVGVFDLDNTSQSRVTKQYLKRAQSDGIIENVSEELPKSFVVCEEDGDSKVYVAVVATSTIGKRSRRAAPLV